MKLNFKVLGSTDVFSLEENTSRHSALPSAVTVSEDETVTNVKSHLSAKLQIATKDLKVVYKGRTLADGHTLSHYKIFDDAKLHVFIAKGSQKIPAAPKYQPGDFWVKLEDILSKAYDVNTAQEILQQFRARYDCMLKTMSLDDIERIATRNLSE